MKANLSNKWISCSFLMRAPCNLGNKSFPSLFKSIGLISSSNKSLIQSRASEVDGFFFNPGISLTSKNLFNAASSNVFFISGKWTWTIFFKVSISGNWI